MTREQLAEYLESQPASPLDALDNREMEAFSIMARGGGTSLICREMNLSEEQAEELKASILRKLKLKDPVGLLQYAARQRETSF
jgi:DNA-binding NarL/FixJ family response regulator